MTTKTISAYVPTYAYSASVWGILRDITSWEEFSESDLPLYLRLCAEIFTEYFGDAANLNKTFTTEDEKQLVFMLESFIQARKLLS